MRRFGAILGLTGPAVCLSLLVQPVLRESADTFGTTFQTASDSATIQMAALERPAGDRTSSRTPVAKPVADKASMKPPRRLMKEGCEGAISSLAGPEARRMVPGRCIA